MTVLGDLRELEDTVDYLLRIVELHSAHIDLLTARALWDNEAESLARTKLETLIAKGMKEEGLAHE